MRSLRPRITYANVVATLALVLAAGAGSSVAALQLAPRSVGAKQIRPGAVTADKVRKHAITAPKIKAGAVKVGKLADGVVTTSKLVNGAVSGEKIALGAIDGEKIVAGAVTGSKVDESSLGQVPNASRAGFATEAESANPAAFAGVDQEGEVDPALAKGITSANVKQGKEAGIYCITVPSFSPRGAQVTPQYNGSGGLNAFVTIGGTASCAAPAVEVQMHNGGLVKAPFYIALYR